MDAAARSAELLEWAKRMTALGHPDGEGPQLDAIDPVAIEGDAARIAFWINVYNACVLREFGERPKAGSLLRQRAIFNEAGARVGGLFFSLNQIEHGLLRRNARPPYALRRVLSASDRRRAAAPDRADPRVHFALNCGASSCPPITAYSADGLEPELDRASAAYVRAETEIELERGRITLPYLLKLYRADFEDPVEFAAAYLGEEDATWLRDERPRIAYAEFDWTIAS